MVAGHTPRFSGGPGSGDPIRDQIVEAIDRLHTELGYWPATNVVRRELKLAPKTLQHHVRILEQAGRIERLHSGRVLRTTPPPPDTPVMQ